METTMKITYPATNQAICAAALHSAGPIIYRWAVWDDEDRTPSASTADTAEEAALDYVRDGSWPIPREIPEGETAGVWHLHVADMFDVISAIAEGGYEEGDKIAISSHLTEVAVAIDVTAEVASDHDGEGGNADLCNARVA